MSLLLLGFVDPGKMPADETAYLKPYNLNMDTAIAQKHFKDTIKKVWRPFTQTTNASQPITELQHFLKDKGFMPLTNLDGVFGYRTLSGVRLFQEYVRTIEGHTEVVPDGIVGPSTQAHIQRWKNNSNLQCEWNQGEASADFNTWIQFLVKAKAHYLAHKNPILALSDSFTKPTSTRKVADWDTSPDSIHIIGIRRNQGRNFHACTTNKDLFVLLVKGMVFYFWGSTVPSTKYSNPTTGFPFLLEGQHAYHFGWHHPNNPVKTYKALRSNGILVFRTDKANSSRSIDNPADLEILFNENNNKRHNPNPNATINIHSSGIGKSSYSAGCQVFAGASYINNHGKVINCLDAQNRMMPRPYGAYCVLEDLLVNYCDSENLTISYTVAREDTGFLADASEQSLFNQVAALEQKMHDALPGFLKMSD